MEVLTYTPGKKFVREISIKKFEAEAKTFGERRVKITYGKSIKSIRNIIRCNNRLNELKNKPNLSIREYLEMNELIIKLDNYVISE